MKIQMQVVRELSGLSYPLKIGFPRGLVIICFSSLGGGGGGEWVAGATGQRWSRAGESATNIQREPPY